MTVNKSKAAFRTIAEVAEKLGVGTHVLRFWETKFSQLKPLKMSGGRRYYRPDDIKLLECIQNLLHNERYTIEGVQKLFREKGIKEFVGDVIQDDFFSCDRRDEPTDLPAGESQSDSNLKPLIADVINELETIKNNLKNNLQ
ncbi:MAG: MerR family transcriptional regulator [Alphaproteobacteria bacterium]|nr:MerR family transcriptional regulator [Alphaproteobacteria bacterium]